MEKKLSRQIGFIKPKMDAVTANPSKDVKQALKDAVDINEKLDKVVETTDNLLNLLTEIEKKEKKILKWINTHKKFKWSVMCVELGIDKGNFQRMLKKEKFRLTTEQLIKIEEKLKITGMQDNQFIIFHIYRLRNPVDNSIFYVGMTRIGLDARLKQHITESNCLTDKLYNRRNLVKANYIHEMRVMGHLPLMELIETHHVITNEDHTNACIREHYWMEFYKKQGEPILNIVGVKRPCGVIKREHLASKIYPPLERLIKKNHNYEQTQRQ